MYATTLLPIPYHKSISFLTVLIVFETLIYNFMKSDYIFLVIPPYC